MNRYLLSMCCVVSVVIGICQVAPAADEYIEVAYIELKVAPENYKYKKIVYSAPFLEVITTRQVLMEKEGLSPQRYLWLEIGDYSVPAIVKKSDTIIEIAAGLKRGQVVKVYGQVRPFTAKPYMTRLSHYYVKVSKIEVTDAFEKPVDRRSVLPPKSRRWRR